MSLKYIVKESLVDFDSYYLKIKTIRIENKEKTNRPTIIFLHDSLGCIELWRDFPQKVAKESGCNVLIYHRLGYGESSPFFTTNRTVEYLCKEAEVLQVLMQKCQISTAILFGHSDGGSIALYAASKYSENVIGVVTEGAHVFLEDITLRGIREAKEAYLITNLKEKLTKYHGDKTENVFNAWVDIWLSDKFRNWDMTDYLADCICPSLIIQGDEDEYGTLQQVDAIVNGTSGVSRKMVIPKTGHTPHKQIPELVINATVDFIQELIPSSE